MVEKEKYTNFFIKVHLINSKIEREQNNVILMTDFYFFIYFSYIFIEIYKKLYNLNFQSGNYDPNDYYLWTPVQPLLL